MKAPGFITTAVLASLLGLVVPTWAAQDQHTDKQDHAKQQQGNHEQVRLAQRVHRQKPSAEVRRTPSRQKQTNQAQQRTEEHAQQRKPAAGAQQQKPTQMK